MGKERKIGEKGGKRGERGQEERRGCCVAISSKMRLSTLEGSSLRHRMF